VNIVYLNRSIEAGFSIVKVFKPVIKLIRQEQTVEIYNMPHFGAAPHKILKNLLFVLKLRRKDAIFHVTGDIHYILLALIGCKVVLTIHDVATLKNAKNKLDYFLKWLLWFYLPIKLANHVVCISNKTKLEVLSVVKKKAISVIHNSVDSGFSRMAENKNNFTPVILHIGTGWNKNLTRVIQALKDIQCNLRIIGRLNAEQLDLLNSSDICYSNDYNLTDEQIVLEYEKCNLVSFPSLFEGFGMPIIEAQAVGRAVLTSNIDPLREVGGNSVHYVEPESVKSIEEGFKALIFDTVYRESIIKKGFVNVERFDVTKIADQYIEIYQKIKI